MTSVADSLSGIARSAALIFGGSVFGRGVGLLCETLIARSLSPTVFGRVSLAYTVAIAVGGVLLLGIHDGVTRLYTAAEDDAERESVVRAGYALSLSAAVVGATGVVLAADAVEVLMGTPDLGRYLRLFAPYVLVYPLSRVSIGLLRGQQQSRGVVVARNLSGRLVGVAVLGVAFALGRQTVGAVAYWLAVPLAVLLTALYFAGWQNAFRGVSSRLPSGSTLREMWSFSWPLALGSIVFLLLSNLDVLMIGYFLEPSKVGYYRSIQPLRQATTVVLGAFSFLFLPLATQYFERGDFAGLDAIFTTVTKWTVLVTLPPVLVLVFFSETVVSLLLGPAYLPAAVPLSILAGGLFLRAVAGLDGDVVQAIDRPKIELQAAALGLCINVTLNVALIPAFGIAGAAAATVCGYGAYNAFELFLIYRATGVTPFSLHTLKPIVASTAVVGAASVAVSRGGIVALTAAVALAVGVVAAAAIVTRSVEEVDLELLARAETKTGRDLGLVRRTLRFGLVGDDD